MRSCVRCILYIMGLYRTGELVNVSFYNSDATLIHTNIIQRLHETDSQKEHPHLFAMNQVLSNFFIYSYSGLHTGAHIRGEGVGV